MIPVGIGRQGSRRGRSLVALAAVAVLGLAACSGGGAPPSDSSGDTGANSGGGGTGLNIAMVTHETPGNNFWNAVQNGAKQAAADTGVTLKYSGDPDASKQAQLVQAAVDSKVDGIATTLATPAAMKGVVTAARSADIPVVAFNAGLNEYQDVGAQMYFGSDESLAGEAGGKRAAEAGAKHILCPIQEAGNVSLEARCVGVKKGAGGATVENLQVNGADDAAVVSTIQAKLSQDKSIDYIIALGAQYAIDANRAKEASGSDAKIATFDLNTDVAQAIQDKTIEFSIDQQPYMQGYMSVVALYLNIRNGNDLGGGGPVLTGPSFVDSSNVDKIAEYTKKNTR